VRKVNFPARQLSFRHDGAAECLISWSAGADMLISFCQKGVCSNSFDGKGNDLGHGFFQNNDERRGIHFDKSENWYFAILLMDKLIFIRYYTGLGIH
jgi:hypothetical protein